MEAVDDGWHQIETHAAGHGSLYWYVLSGGEKLPDPAACYQPLDVGGPSEVIDHGRYSWGNKAWRGRPWFDAFIYELHVGAFSAEGAFRAVINKLSHLAAFGITAIETKDGRATAFNAQWNDDVHHALHTAATGEDVGYYEEYLGDRAKLARALAESFAFQGEYMDYRGSARSEPSAGLPPSHS